MDDNMSYTIDVDITAKLIRVKYSSNTTYMDRLDVLEELVAVLRDEPSLNILIDVRDATENMSMQQQLDYGKKIAEHAEYFSRIKTAVLANNEFNPHPLIISGAYVNGVNHICEFNNESEALGWLGGSYN